jgi:hypothetical protein
MPRASASAEVSGHYGLGQLLPMSLNSFVTYDCELYTSLDTALRACSERTEFGVIRVKSTPHPNPLPQGERKKNRASRWGRGRQAQ